jgi:dolichol-phosphate mannosyltransferase
VQLTATGATAGGPPGVGLGNPWFEPAGDPEAAADGLGDARCVTAALDELPQAMISAAVATTRDRRMKVEDSTPGISGRSLILEAAPAKVARARVGVVIPAFNEGTSLGRLLPRIPKDVCELVVVVNDGSTDDTSAVCRDLGATVIDRPVRGGPGPAIRDGLDYLRSEGFDVAAVMASNGKHDPAELPDLVRPLVDGDVDLVRGSRHMTGGGHVNIPWHRLFMIQVFTVLFSLLAGRRVTDATGGFQAYRLRILDDPRVDLHQEWLGRYEVETYLFAKTLLCGYRWKEVPVNITYGRRGPYTRARPIVDWWGYFRPIVLLRFGLKH